MQLAGGYMQAHMFVAFVLPCSQIVMSSACCYRLRAVSTAVALSHTTFFAFAALPFFLQWKAQFSLGRLSSSFCRGFKCQSRRCGSGSGDRGVKLSSNLNKKLLILNLEQQYNVPVG